jgi:Domain of unknown function (DUF4399)
MRTITPIAALLLMILPTVMLGQQSGSEGLPRTPSPAGAAAYIISPQAGEHVTSPVTVKFGLSGMGVAPAGVENANTGHHHLLIDVAELPPDNLPLPATDQIRHFGGGQTEATIELPPGRHTLQLVLGDARHVPHNPPVRSEKITITVVAK